MRRPFTLVLGLAAALHAGSTRAQVVPDGFAVQTLAPGLSAPVSLDFLPDGRLLFAEQLTGYVRVFREGTGVQSQPVLQVSGVAAGGERGLLGVAVDPAFPSRPYLYVHYTVAFPRQIRIARFTLQGDLDGTTGGPLFADLVSRYDVIDGIVDNADNHNGGTVRFGADGLLYVSLGEDGDGCRAQDTTRLGGVVLRLRVNTLPPGPGHAFKAQITPADNPFVSRPDSNIRLVAALGLRNPFRIQPDRVRGWLVIGDVGETKREELDVMALTPQVSLPGLGADFGWPYFEGSAAGPGGASCPPEPLGLVFPIYDYDRTQQFGGAAIIAAGAYWPPFSIAGAWPGGYAGNLFANDYYSGDFYRLVQTSGGWEIAPAVPGQPAAGKWGIGFNAVSDWTVGPDGAFWFCRQSVDFAANTGSIGRIVNTAPPPPPPPPFSVRVRSLPAQGSAQFIVRGEPGPVRLTLRDAGGRSVRAFHAGDFSATASGLELTWDGRDGDGRAVRPGIYWATAESEGRHVTARVPFLR